MPRPVAPPPPDLLAVATAQEGLLSARQCEEHSLCSARRRRLVTAGAWVQVTHAVFDTDPTPPRARTGPEVLDHRQRRRIWAALLAHGPDAVAVGASSLVMRGVQGFPLGLAPEVALPRGRFGRTADGLVVRQYRGEAVETVRGAPVLEARLALAQAVPRLGRRRAVAVMDSALHREVVTRAGLARAHELARGRRGVARTHDWWDLARKESESPLESFARIEALDAGRPPDRLQVPVTDGENRFLGRGDLGWLLPDGRWFVLEADGAGVHSTLHALFHDRTRQNAMLTAGSAVVARVTAQDLAVEGKVGDAVVGWLAALGRRR